MFRLSEKGEKIQQMFGTIAPRYDFLNRMLSFGIDRRWRKKAVRLLKYRDVAHILDVATGTGDVALEIARTTPPSVKITGADFCKEMVDLGQIKAAQSPYAQPDRFQGGALRGSAVSKRNLRFDNHCIRNQEC